MEAGTAPAVASQIGGGSRGGGFRGRGVGPLRGSFERGRGRGISRGHFMGGMGRIGMGGAPPPQGLIPGGPRGMRPRGGMGGFQNRGSYQPRGAQIGMRGGRPPMYQQRKYYNTYEYQQSADYADCEKTEPKQHSGADNNKTVSPVPIPGTTTSEQQTSDKTSDESATTAANTVTASTTSVSSTVVTAVSNAQVSSAPASNGNSSAPPYTRAPRGRGSSYTRGGGRGGYNMHMNGSAGNGMYGTGQHHGGVGGGPSIDHGQMPRRGGMRGRGGYGQSIPRPPMHQPHNMQIASVQAIKRGAPGGLGAKRARYETNPYSQRPIVPKYHVPPQHMGAMQPQSNYGPPANHHQAAQSHHGYATHDQTQVDPYAQSSYSATANQTAYNGYGQNSGYATHATQAVAPASTGYTSHHSTEYDQNQYQTYSSSAYATQDTRYQAYSQDYTQQYGAAAVDYNTAQQADYAQQTATYDERAYTGYDAQAYQQNYSNAAAYY